ncbi:selenide, water dikinase SelD [bacterium]|nr:selenide, water dikinase SelD [bacterium]
MTRPIYLDYNATTPIDPGVAAVMRPYLEEFFGNPSSSHWYGVQTHKAVEKARRQVADLIGARPGEVVFTSGGSESNNYALKGAAFALRSRGNHIITSVVEHPAVGEVCRYLESQGFAVSSLPVDESGLVDPADLEDLITPRTILLSVMHANNETGTIQPIAELAEIAHRHGIVVHSDAAQSVGKIPVDVAGLGVDLLSIAGHKFYGPKGIGALYIRPGVTLEKLIHGADHERNLRAGTENVLEIAGLGAAAEIAAAGLGKNAEHSRSLRDLLWDRLQAALPDMRLNGHPVLRLPNTLNVSFPHIEANTLLSELTGVAASAGAACHAESVDVSSVIAAMKVPPEYAMGTVRFSTGKFLTRKEVEDAADQVIAAVERLRPREAGPVGPVAGPERDSVKLTHFTHGLGCACKLRPQVLEEVVRKLPPVNDPAVLVGTGSSDDAAVYRLDHETAIVATVDFFTPIVDDPYHFGAIAAANALSDVYAMGAQPLFALNIVGFPTNRLPVWVLEEILKGAADKAAEAGIPIVGGHTVDDTEPKFGMAVTGRVHPDRILSNAGARPQDRLILTKPLGLGIITTALKRGLVDPATADEAIRIMAALNRTAAEVMSGFDLSAVTDVTGFGLLGHLREMTIGSGVDAEVVADKVPVIPAAWDHAAAGIVPGGTRDNQAFVADSVDWTDGVSELQKTLLCDAQTSGGLLIAVAAAQADDLVAALREAGVDAAVAIGSIMGPGTGKIRVRLER